jgi:hypothetical protein
MFEELVSLIFFKFNLQRLFKRQDIKRELDLDERDRCARVNNGHPLAHQLRIPGACRDAFGLLMSGAYPWTTGGKESASPTPAAATPEHMATLASLSWRPHILFPAASAWNNPRGFGV